MRSNSVIRNSVTDNRSLIKIVVWVGHVRHSIRNNVKVKRSKVEVTRSRDVVAQKHQIYHVNITREWKCNCLIGNLGRQSK